MLVGKKSSLGAVSRVLEDRGVHNIRTSRFFQGKTIRWGLAWSLTTDGCDARGRPPPGPFTVVI